VDGFTQRWMMDGAGRGASDDDAGRLDRVHRVRSVHPCGAVVWTVGGEL